MEERISANIEFEKDLCSCQLGQSVDVAVCKRLRSKDGKTATRPMLVTVNDKSQVNRILKEARKLKDVDEFKNLYIKKDPTPLERQEMKSLIELIYKKLEETKSQKGGGGGGARTG